MQAIHTFTSAILRKKGRKFEIIWVSRDQSGEDFLAYYQKMPWLAVTMENTPAVLQNLAPKYQMKGIPHFVILDGYDASVYTLDGRTMVKKDKYGLEFPWQPRTLMSILPRPIKQFIQLQVQTIKAKLHNVVMGILESITPQWLLKSIFKAR